MKTKKKQLKRKMSDKSGHEFWKKLAENYPENEFVRFKAKYYVPYSLPDNLSDDELLYDALKEKYGL